MSVKSVKGQDKPSRFFPLTLYANEVARGLVHTAAWDEKMARLLAEHDVWSEGAPGQQTLPGSTSGVKPPLGGTRG